MTIDWLFLNYYSYLIEFKCSKLKNMNFIRIFNLVDPQPSLNISTVFIKFVETKTVEYIHYYVNVLNSLYSNLYTNMSSSSLLMTVVTTNELPIVCYQ